MLCSTTACNYVTSPNTHTVSLEVSSPASFIHNHLCSVLEQATHCQSHSDLVKKYADLYTIILSLSLFIISFFLSPPPPPPHPLSLPLSHMHTYLHTFFIQNCYNERVEIETSQGVFQVPIKAQLPTSNLVLPDSLKLGMCAVNESVTVNFEVSNVRYRISRSFHQVLLIM